MKKSGDQARVWGMLVLANSAKERAHVAKIEKAERICKFSHVISFFLS